MQLADVLGHPTADAITASRQITFHAVGDTGAGQVGKIPDEAKVADTMAADASGPPEAGPSFFFHLGDVVYNFGEAQYYYDQFFEPYRAYDRPISPSPAITTEWSSSRQTATPLAPTLQAFLRNFCATATRTVARCGALGRDDHDPAGRLLHARRTAVSIIGLYSNVLEGPGVSRRTATKYPTVGDMTSSQFLQNELHAPEGPARANGERAVILAVHHPPGVDRLPSTVEPPASRTTSTQHAKQQDCRPMQFSRAMLTSTNATYAALTAWRFQYIVAGSGGHNATALKGGVPKLPITSGEYTLWKTFVEFGYSTVTVDMTATPAMLSLRWTGLAGSRDVVTVESPATNEVASQSVT